jgi:hypothetical protein
MEEGEAAAMRTCGQAASFPGSTGGKFGLFRAEVYRGRGFGGTQVWFQ